MNIDELTLGQIKQLQGQLGTSQEATPPTPVGQYCVVRCRDAGVHAGVVVGVDRANRIVWLSDSRRLWRWWSRFTLSELADEGVRTDKVGECRFSAPTAATVEIAGWCEIRPCSDAAEKSIRGVPNANT